MLQLAGYTASLSALLLVFHAFRDRQKRREHSEPEGGVQDPHGPVTVKSETKVVLGCQYLRVLGCTALLGLSIASALVFPDKCGVQTDSESFVRVLWQWDSSRSKIIGLILTFAYTIFLSISAIVVAAAPRWNAIFTRHLNAILFVVLAIYGYRDIYPLITFNKVPLDICEGAVLWTKITLLGILAVVIPLCIPRRYIPVDLEHTMSHPNPEQTASILSLAVFSFMDSIVFKAYRVSHLPYDQLPPLSDSDRVGTLKKWYFPFLDIYSGAKKRSMVWSLLWMFRNQWIQMTLAMIVYALGTTGSPVAVNRILRSLELDGNGEQKTIRPWFWIFVLFASSIASTASMQWYLRVAFRTIVHLESLVTQLVFEHALRIRVKAEVPQSNPSPSTETSSTTKSSSTSKKSRGSKNLVGRINNVVTTDLSNMNEIRTWVALVVSRPLEFVLSTVFLYVIFGWSAFVGIGLMMLLAPIPGRIINLGRRLFLERMKKTDSRVQIFTDVMNVLRMIKLFGWERKMSERISVVRVEELDVISRRRMILMLRHSAPFCNWDFRNLTLIMKQDLTASKVFSSLVVFEKLQRHIQVLFVSLNRLYTAKVSMDRVTDFLTNTELLDSFSKSSEVDHVPEDDAQPAQPETVTNASGSCGFRKASFSWSNDVASEGESSRTFLLTVEDELLFKPNAINLILGPTGSGKTSMLLALLGEMHFIPSGSDSWYHLPREGGVAYATQESWVQNETIKTNILFSSEYDETRYKKVLYQCALERDLSLFEAGDLTEVGEKGITLSGGQKARLTLARAVYSQARILLLDDILAALDVHTSRWVVEKCLKGDLVKGRTVILVTHNTALTRPMAEFVLSLKDGRVVSQETIASEAGSVEFNAMVEKLDQEIDASVPSDIKNGTGTDGKLVVAEEIQEGHVGLPAIKLYALGMGGTHIFTFFSVFLVGVFLASFTNIFQTWYLGYWASQYETRDPREVPVSLYLGGYVGIVTLIVGINCIIAVVYIYGTIRASESIHRQLVDNVFGATMRWLDKTPVSRIITRSTQDINSVDNNIPLQLRNFVDVSVGLVMELGAVLLFTPLFIIPGILVLLLGFWCANVYLKAQMSVKREMSIAKAPILGHFGATISGLTSIRAYGAQDTFMREMQARTDRHSRIARVFTDLQRWMAMRVNSLSAVFTASLAWYLVNYVKGSASETGFSLNMAVLFSMSIFTWVLDFNTLEAQSNSLERIEHYLHIEQEPKATESGKPPAYWPSSGDLVVENLCARYSPDGPEVLHNLSFQIRSGERIGVVGRTGSGKSSLTLSLLRCILTTGKVLYDGLLTSSINLDELRSKITIIPQAPDLISGTLRVNLDPFEEHDDLTLNNALKSAGLFSLQEDTLDEGKITLDTAVSSGGGNFSMGQRQIIALARAIIRQSKLLILDEATSAIDYKTDSIIQSSLRSQLAGGVTLLTIAHRLQTVMDSDRIMVLDAGRIVEFDTPKELLKNSGGYLRTLVENSHDKDVLLSLVYGDQP